MLGLFRQKNKAVPGFQKILTAAELLSASDVVIPDTTNFHRLGSYTVPAQQRIAFGYGRPDQPFNQGYLYVKLVDDAAGDEDGTLRLGQEDANGLNKTIVWEGRTEELDGDANDKQKRIALPEQVQFPLVGEDSKLFMELKADGADTVDVSACTVRVPVTVYIVGGK